MRRLACILLSLACSITAWATESWPTGAQGYITVTIPTPDANVSTPVPIVLTDATVVPSAKTQSDGWVIYDAATSVRLNHEQEANSYDASGKYAHGVVWVSPAQYSSPSGSQNQVRIYYGATLTDASNVATGVWDANYVGVWHLGESGSPYADSTSNGNASTGGTYPSQGTGVVGKCQSFTPSQYIYVGNSNLPSGNAACTLSGWSKSSSSSEEGIVTVGNASGGYPASIGYTIYLLNYYGQPLFGLYGGVPNVTGSGGYADGKWHHFAGSDSYSSPTNTLSLYVDGAYVAQGTSTVQNIQNTLGATLGAEQSSGPVGFWTGSIEEVRVSKIARSAAWVKQEYTSVVTGLTYGSPQGPPASGIPRQSDFYNRMRGH